MFLYALLMLCATTGFLDAMDAGPSSGRTEIGFPGSAFVPARPLRKRRADDDHVQRVMDGAEAHKKTCAKPVDTSTPEDRLVRGVERLRITTPHREDAMNVLVAFAMQPVPDGPLKEAWGWAFRGFMDAARDLFEQEMSGGNWEAALALSLYADGDTRHFACAQEYRKRSDELCRLDACRKTVRSRELEQCVNNIRILAFARESEWYARLLAISTPFESRARVQVGLDDKRSFALPADCLNDVVWQLNHNRIVGAQAQDVVPLVCQGIRAVGTPPFCQRMLQSLEVPRTVAEQRFWDEPNHALLAPIVETLKKCLYSEGSGAH